MSQPIFQSLSQNLLFSGNPLSVVSSEDHLIWSSCTPTAMLNVSSSEMIDSSTQHVDQNYFSSEMEGLSWSRPVDAMFIDISLVEGSGLINGDAIFSQLDDIPPQELSKYLKDLSNFPELLDVLNLQQWSNLQKIEMMELLELHKASPQTILNLQSAILSLDDPDIDVDDKIELLRIVFENSEKFSTWIFKDFSKVIKCLCEAGWSSSLQMIFLKKYFVVSSSGSFQGMKHIPTVIQAMTEAHWSFIDQSKFLLTLCNRRPGQTPSELLVVLASAIKTMKAHDWPVAQQVDFIVKLLDVKNSVPSSVLLALDFILKALNPVDWSMDEKFDLIFKMAQNLESNFLACAKFTKPIFETLNSLGYGYDDQCLLIESMCIKNLYASIVFLHSSEALKTLNSFGWNIDQQCQLFRRMIMSGGFDVEMILHNIPHILLSVSQRPFITDPVQFVLNFFETDEYSFSSNSEVSMNLRLCLSYANMDSNDGLLAADLAYTVMKEVKRYNFEPGHIEKELPKLQANMIEIAALADMILGTQIFKAVPGGNIGLIDQYKKLAEDISLLVDRNKWSVLRETIHNHPSANDRNLFLEYKSKAEQMNHELALKKIDEALEIFGKLYEQNFDQDEYKVSLHKDVSSALSWMSDPRSLVDIGKLAISVRDVFESKIKIPLSSKYLLIRLMISLDQVAYGLCSVSEDDRKNPANPQQIAKISALIRIMYGCGYGQEGILHLANRLDSLSCDEGISHRDRYKLLKSYASLIYKILQDFELSYRETFAPIPQLYGNELEISQELRPGFSSNQFRATGVFKLDNHLELLGVTAANDRISKQVLSLLGKEISYPYVALDYHQQDFPQNRLIVGGKGSGLNFMATRYPDHVPEGFVLPARPAGYRLSESDKHAIRIALADLEMRTGRKLGVDLMVSVRSGGPVSMPGAMQTKLFVNNLDSIYQHIESVYQSWNSEAAKAYRQQNGIPDDWGTAVNIVRMVSGQFDENSGSGIVVSRLEMNYARNTCGDRLADGLEEGLDSLSEDLSVKLLGFVDQFEKILCYPVEIEFTVESNHLYLLQVRRANLTREQEIAWYAKGYIEKLITHVDAINALGGVHRLEQDLDVSVLQNDSGVQEIALGSFGEGRPYSGKIVLSSEEVAEEFHKDTNMIYVTDNPDARVSTANAMMAKAFIVSGGGQLAHLFSVARDHKISFIGGANFLINRDDKQVVVGEKVYRTGDVLTIDPVNRKIYDREIPIRRGPSPVKFYINLLLNKNKR